jgi:hypothetical protein
MQSYPFLVYVTGLAVGSAGLGMVKHENGAGIRPGPFVAGWLARLGQ